MEALLQNLKLMQANAFVFYTKAHGFHWNVEGALFKQFHSFFGEIYSDVFESIDTYAEWSRRLGQYAPFQIPEIFAISNVKYDDGIINNPMQMLQALAISNEIVITDLKNGFNIANLTDEQGLANFIAERIEKHEFWRWQLIASLKSMINI